MFPIAGIGERRSFPNRPNSTGFEKPDLSVVEVDEIGVIYTVWLGVQHFRRQERPKDGLKGKSELIRYSLDVLTLMKSADVPLRSVIAVASVCGFYIHLPLPLYTAAKQYISPFCV